MTTPEPSILFIHSSNEMYGSDRVLLDTIQSLPVSARVRATVWIPADSVVTASPSRFQGELDALGVRYDVRPLPILRRALLTPRGVLGLARLTREARQAISDAAPDVVYAASSACVMSLVAASRAGVTARVLHCQEVWGRGERALLGFAAHFATGIVCTSQAVLRALPPRLRRVARVIRNCVDLPASVVPHARGGKAGPVYVFASRWAPRKGLAFLLDAWARAGIDGELVILGGPPGLGASDSVDESLAQQPRPSTIHVVGEVDEIGEYLERADAAIVPSLAPEGFGLIVAEAHARGRAVIASRVPGLDELVDDGVTGRLCPPGDVEALAQILRDSTRDELARWGVSGRRSARESLSRSRFDSEMRQLWKVLR